MSGVTLTEFLLARIADDEAVASAVTAESLNDVTNPIWTGDDPWPTERAFAERFTVGRVLAECEAKRRIVEEHHPHDHGGDHGDAVFCDACQWDHGDDSPRIDNQPIEGFGQNPCRTLLALALPYADHPDYDEAWRL